VTSCTPCARAKATCKPFNTNRACAKARVEIVWRSRASKAKQQTDAEWKAEILKKLEGLSELSGLRKDVWRIVVALEKLAGIESQDSDEELLSWPESEGEMTEVQRSKEKGKQKKERLDKEDEGGEAEIGRG